MTGQTVFVVPGGVHDPPRTSGGNVYDRRLSAELRLRGWRVAERELPGSWPCPDRTARQHLAGLLGDLADRTVVLVDGLVADGAGDVLVPHLDRLRLVLLVHSRLGLGATGTDTDQALLRSAAAVVTTSNATALWLARDGRVPHGRVLVAAPGVDAAPLAAGSASGRQLLCLAAVTAGKGHDVLLDALSALPRTLDWHLRCVGRLDLEPDFVSRLLATIRTRGLAGRVALTGPLTGHALDEVWNGTDLLVLATRSEGYGMVVTEALARGIPVVASRVGGVPEALGRVRGVRGWERPGVLVPTDRPAEWTSALRQWMGSAERRSLLAGLARARRQGLTDWRTTAAQVAGLLEQVAA